MNLDAGPRHVVLIGLMGSGKSTVGRGLAARLGRPFLDNDDLLMERTGRRAREIAEAEGADALHRHERDVLCAAIAEREPAVITAAAGAVFGEAVDALRSHDVVYLWAPPDLLAARVDAAARDGHRPFVGDDTVQVLRAHYDERDEIYRSVATFVADTQNRTPERVVDQITLALARAGRRTRRGSRSRAPRKRGSR
jgi:shikimate kinase